VALAVSGDAGPAFGRNAVLRQGTGVAGLAVRERQPVVTPDLFTDPRVVVTPEARALLEPAPHRAVLCVPLLIQETVIGALSVGDRAGRMFDREEVRVAQAFAVQAALALETAWLYQETRQQLRQTETLLTVGQAVSSTLELPEVVRRTTREMVRALGADMGSAWCLSPSRDQLIPMAGYHFPRELIETLFRAPLPIERPLIEEAKWLEGPIYSSDSQADPRFDHPLARLVPHKSILLQPMWWKGERIGGFAILWVRAAHRFIPEELRLVDGIARQAAGAIENARLIQELRTHQTRLEALLEVSRQFSRIQPVESLLTRIAEACGRLLDADSVGFRIVEGDELVVTGTWGDAKGIMLTPRLKIGESLSGIVAATGEPLLVTDPGNDPRLIPAHREALRRLGLGAALLVPVKVGERVMGVLSIHTRRSEGFAGDTLASATAFASQAATALENARLYQEARQAYDELARTQQQLLQVQKMEAIGRLAGGVAHDFNNLLTVLGGRSRLLLDRLRRDDPLRRDIELIQETADRAATLTQQLLAFSRKQVLAPKVLDLNAVVVNMDTMLRRLIGEDIDLVTVPGPALGRVKADPGQIEQVIMNLAINARDAMPRGGQLTIETANVELDEAYARRHVAVRPGPHVMLAVSDTGPGMDAETQARVFEPFFTTKEPGKGTGLGLATVYGIVKQSGGNIWVYSEPGRGTTFKIYLPRVEEAAEPVEPAKALAGPPRGLETVLVVEDDEALRELAREILQSHGYTVLEARHGGEALPIGERHAGPIHLLVTDVVMPWMSGRELARRLMPAHPEMKVLYVSGYTENAVVHNGVLDPDTAFLQKPFTPDALARKVREVLDAPRAG